MEFKATAWGARRTTINWSSPGCIADLAEQEHLLGDSHRTSGTYLVDR
jgi:hypothetical protein